MSVHDKSVAELRHLLENGETTSVTITTEFLNRIEADSKKEDRSNSFIEVYKEEALEFAGEADKRTQNGERTPFLGIPVALKDNLNLKGHPTTCGSRILEGYKATFSSSAVRKLEEQGAVFIGKTNMDEFAMGSSNETSAYGPARNPVDRERIPGGSSGGSAAAVAAALAPIALGSDTGGSIRQPAGLCGVVGLKPTYGRVSRYGLVAFASSLDQIGPLARTVEDSASMLGAIAGLDPHDSTTAEEPVPDYLARINDGVAGMKIGVPEEYFTSGLDPQIEAQVRKGIETLKEQGAEIVDISLPMAEYAVAVYYVVATAEASSNLARFDGIRYGRRARDASDLLSVFTRSRDEGFGSEVKRRILLGTYVLSSGYYDAYYLKALQARTLIRKDFEDAFAKVDTIVAPVTPTAAFKIGEKVDDPIAMYLSDIYTISANLAGIPGLSVPCGRTKKGLPVGIQLFAPHFAEATLFKTGQCLEKNL